ncbi:MAG: DUF559 domain-containing protein [Bacteroidota bacterium]|nr:DUF559 domain-containing protein [Bacteroidota bacterium]
MVIEIDGKIHDYKKRNDKLRTTVIKDLGLEVIRFKNEELENDLQSVLKKLERIIMKKQMT